MPEPGWYRDPYDPSRLRWWDGAAWTQRTHDQAAWHGAGASRGAAHDDAATAAHDDAGLTREAPTAAGHGAREDHSVPERGVREPVGTVPTASHPQEPHDPDAGPVDRGPPTWVWFLVGVLGLGLIGAVAVIALRAAGDTVVIGEPTAGATATVPTTPGTDDGAGVTPTAPSGPTSTGTPAPTADPPGEPIEPTRSPTATASADPTAPPGSGVPTSEAPVDLSGGARWVAVAASLPTDEASAATARDRAERIAAELPVGLTTDILLSDRYPSLNAGYWVVWIGGPWSSADGARQACTRSGVAGCYARVLADQP